MLKYFITRFVAVTQPWRLWIYYINPAFHVYRHQIEIMQVPDTTAVRTALQTTAPLTVAT